MGVIILSTALAVGTSTTTHKCCRWALNCDHAYEACRRDLEAAEKEDGPDLGVIVLPAALGLVVGVLLGVWAK